MNVWDVEEAMKWADTWGPTDGEPPTGDQLALAALSRAVRAAAAELASMRTCFEAADRERSELRERAERAEAERDALRAALELYRGQVDQTGRHSAAEAIDRAVQALGARETPRAAKKTREIK